MTAKYSNTSFTHSNDVVFFKFSDLKNRYHGSRLTWARGKLGPLWGSSNFDDVATARKCLKGHGIKTTLYTVELSSVFSHSRAIRV